jgi:hypothetical protein
VPIYQVHAMWREQHGTPPSRRQSILPENKIGRLHRMFDDVNMPFLVRDTDAKWLDVGLMEVMEIGYYETNRTNHRSRCNIYKRDPDLLKLSSIHVESILDHWHRCVEFIPD